MGRPSGSSSTRARVTGSRRRQPRLGVAYLSAWSPSKNIVAHIEGSGAVFGISSDS
jgi:hypothetical protein